MNACTPSELEGYLAARFIEHAPGVAWRVVCRASTTSTMALAAESFEALGLQERGVALALEQRAGRGRQGRQWISPPGALVATAAFRTDNSFKQLSGFSLVVGLALLETLGELCKGTQVAAGLRLKWPNDLLDREGKKLAGILVETKGVDESLLVLAGIGLNLSEAPAQIGHATCLEAVAQRHGASAPAALEVAARLFPTIDRYWVRFEQHGFSQFRADWLEQAAFRGDTVTADIGSGPISGTVKGLTTEGLLILDIGGEERIISSGEIFVD